MGMAGNNTGTLIINIENDLIVKEGCFYDAGIISSNKSGTILNIKGDVNLLGGAFDFNRSKDGVSLINVCNTAEPCRWMQKSTCDVTVGNICITPRAHMLMKGDKLGNIAKDRTLTVMSDAQLMCGNSVIAGDGEFVLQDKATLGIGSPQGINSEIQEGNIVTAKRTFHSGANYYYYMNNSPQSTGKFITSPKDNTVRSIILNKDKTSQVLYVAQPMNVMEQITINKGDIDQSKNKLMLPGMSDKENN